MASVLDQKVHDAIPRCVHPWGGVRILEALATEMEVDWSLFEQSKRTISNSVLVLAVLSCFAWSGFLRGVRGKRRGRSKDKAARACERAGLKTLVSQSVFISLIILNIFPNSRS